MTPAVFLLSLVTAAACVAVGRRLAIVTGVVARPNPVVSDHVKPVALLGGTAVFSVFLVLPVLRLGFAGNGVRSWDIARLIGVAGFVVVGTVDDCRPFGPVGKLVCEIVVCGAALVALGDSPLLRLVVETVILVTLVNAYNLVDVMDGLLCTISLPAFAGFLLTPGLLPSESKSVLWLAVACVLALFLYNRPPASVYGGDAASLPIGFLVGSCWLEVARVHEFVTASAAILLVSVPLAEVALIVAARIRRRVSPFRPSRDHFSLRLRDQLGWSRPRILMVTLLVAGAYCAVPATVSSAPALVGAAYVSLCVVIGLICMWMCWRLNPAE